MNRWLATVTIFSFLRCTLGASASLISNDHIGFVLKAVKSVNADQEENGGYFCFELESPFAEKTSDFFFIIDVVDTLPFQTDTHRFGGTNVERGKQSLDMTIYNTDTRDLVRSKRNLQSGTSVIQVNPHGSRRFSLCFINLSFDSSWKFLDAMKTVRIKMATYDSNQKNDLKSPLAKEMTIHTIQEMEECTERLLKLMDTRENSELLRLESERRDLNEEVFTWLLYGEVAFTLGVIASHVMLTYQFIKNVGNRINASDRRKRIDH